jgi:hypothetical protein
MTLDELETIVEAVRAGKTVQIERRGEWHDYNFAAVLSTFAPMRVKTEPREYWLVLTPTTHCLCQTEYGARENIKAFDNTSIKWDLIHVREVIN